MAEHVHYPLGQVPDPHILYLWAFLLHRNNIFNSVHRTDDSDLNVFLRCFTHPLKYSQNRHSYNYKMVLNSALCFIMLRNEKAHNNRGNLEAMSQICLLQFLCMKSVSNICRKQHNNAPKRSWIAD